MKMRIVVVATLAFAIAIPVFSAGNKTYKTTYPVPCSDLWGAVKVALSNPDNYKDVEIDENNMAADYNVKHSIHWSVIGAVNQGKNHVSLLSTGSDLRDECRIDV